MTYLLLKLAAKYWPIALLGTFLPIWRAAPDKRGMTFFEYAAYTGSDKYQATHIPFNDAVEKAEESWQRNSLNHRSY